MIPATHRVPRAGLAASLGFVLAAAAAAGAQTPAASTPSAAPAVQRTPDPFPVRCTLPNIDLDHPVPLDPPQPLIDGLVKSYSAPEIVGLRDALDRVATGTADKESTRTMQGVSPALLANRFILISNERGIGGGWWIHFQFRDHPEAMYRVWIYGHGATSREGPFSIRAWDRGECSEREQYWMKARYGDLERKMPGG